MQLLNKYFKNWSLPKIFALVKILTIVILRRDFKSNWWVTLIIKSQLVLHKEEKLHKIDKSEKSRKKNSMLAWKWKKKRQEKIQLKIRMKWDIKKPLSSNLQASQHKITLIEKLRKYRQSQPLREIWQLKENRFETSWKITQRVWT